MCIRDRLWDHSSLWTHHPHLYRSDSWHGMHQVAPPRPHFILSRARILRIDGHGPIRKRPQYCLDSTCTVAFQISLLRVRPSAKFTLPCRVYRPDGIFTTASSLVKSPWFDLRCGEFGSDHKYSRNLYPCMPLNHRISLDKTNFTGADDKRPPLDKFNGGERTGDREEFTSLKICISDSYNHD